MTRAKDVMNAIGEQGPALEDICRALEKVKFKVGKDSASFKSERPKHGKIILDVGGASYSVFLSPKDKSSGGMYGM